MDPQKSVCLAIKNDSKAEKFNLWMNIEHIQCSHVCFLPRKFGTNVNYSRETATCFPHQHLCHMCSHNKNSRRGNSYLQDFSSKENDFGFFWSYILFVNENRIFVWTKKNIFIKLFFKIWLSFVNTCDFFFSVR